MSVHAHQSLSEHKFLADIICAIPAGGSETMAVYGSVFGRGAGAAGTKTFSNLVGKTLLITDTLATNVGQKEIKFKSSDFVKADQPSLNEIVTAINAVLALDATPTIASVGSNGELKIAAAAASATGGLTIGAGTANVLLGFPKNGVFFTVINGTGVTVTFPAGMQREYIYGHAPFVDVTTYTPATAVRVNNAQFTATYTPSARTLVIANAGGAARIAHIRIAF